MTHASRGYDKEVHRMRCIFCRYQRMFVACVLLSPAARRGKGNETITVASLHGFSGRRSEKDARQSSVSNSASSIEVAEHGLNMRNRRK